MMKHPTVNHGRVAFIHLGLAIVAIVCIFDVLSKGVTKCHFDIRGVAGVAGQSN
jgi:hypothetical protein